MGKETGELAHITVDPLDQFTGRMVVVESHVQAEHVQGQVAAQGIGRGPTDSFAHVGGGDIKRGLAKAKEDKKQRNQHEPGCCGAALRCVYHGAN